MIKQYHTIQSYLDDTLDFLLENPVKNNIIIGQCLNTKNKKKQVENTILINVFLGEKLVLTLFKNLAKALIVGKENSTEHLQELSTYLKEKNIAFSGIIAEKSLALCFSKIYNSIFKIEKTLIAHQLNKLKTVQIREGEFAICTQDDLDLVSDWIHKFQVECALDNQRSQKDLRKDMALYIEQKKFYKWIVNNQIVSVAAINSETNYYSKISLVYTPPEFRRKNYARSCVWSLTKLILDTQSTVCLFTDKSNPTSNKIYGEIGFEPVNEDYMIEF